MIRWMPILLFVLPVVAQAPTGWYQRPRLGEGAPAGETWYGAGLWSGDHHGPATTLTDSLGLGNSLTGGGFHLEGGITQGRWDLAAEVMGVRDDQGQAYLTLYRSHLWYQGETGWQAGLEQEPLVWGYGINGGYVLGEAARPFPRVRVESPMADLHVGRVPLGQWGFQFFTGKLDNHRVLPPEVQDASARSRAIAAQGDVEGPLLTGYRVQATFGPLVEFYLNLANLWAGTLNGMGMTSGYNLGDYLTAMTGTKDVLAEGGVNIGAVTGPQNTPYVNSARSASELAWGLRVQVPSLSRLLGAQKVYLYVDRGTKSALWPWRLFLKNPTRHAWDDVSFDWDSLVKTPNLGQIWYQRTRYSAPTVAQPNDAVGIQADWGSVRAGLEYYAGTNSAGTGFRPFVHSIYLTGFYYYGDPLGNGLGGELNCTTLKVEVDLSRRFSGALTVLRGFRPFRDNLEGWEQDHPGDTPGKNRFTGVQQTLAMKVNAITTVDVGAAWQRQDAVEYALDRQGNGFAWFTDITFRWPSKPRSWWNS